MRLSAEFSLVSLTPASGDAGRYATSLFRYKINVLFTSLQAKGLTMLRIATTVLLFCVSTPVAHSGIIYDATADFSTAANPNGVWSYHFSDDTNRDGAYDLFTDVDPLGGSGSDVWHAGGPPTQRPFAGVNTTPIAGTGSWAVNELALHPGQSAGGGGDGLAVLTWTSPFTGSADVAYSLAMALGGNVEWFFEQNSMGGVTTHDQGFLIGSAATDSISLTRLSVSAGDQLNLVLDTNGSTGSDLVRLPSATITAAAVPEPSTVTLSLLALAGFVVHHRRLRGVA